jgi:hypothetical protein
VHKNEDTFDNGKSSREESVEDECQNDKRNSEESAMIWVRHISGYVEHKDALDKSAGHKGSPGDAGLPSNGAKIAYRE